MDALNDMGWYSGLGLVWATRAEKAKVPGLVLSPTPA